MKFILFNAREDEKKALNLYKQLNPNIEIDVYFEALSLDNMHYINDSYDAIILAQVKAIPDEIYYKIKECGINVFATRSAGIDMYNLKLLKELGIRLVRVPVYSPNAIAEYALSGAMYFSRNFDLIQENVSNFDFRWQSNIISEELRNKTVGIIGTGNIGRTAAKLFKALGSKLIGYDLYQNDEAKEILDYVDDIETLVKQSDIISLHIPATEENNHLFNDEMFKNFKPNAILINTARGSLIDTKALLKALDNKQLRAAVLDVYEFEGPYVNKINSKEDIKDEILLELLSRKDILYSPHIAFYTNTAIENLVHIAINGAKKILNNEECVEEVKL